MLPELQSQLSFRKCNIPLCDEICIKFLDIGDVFIELLHGVICERVGIRYCGVHIVTPQASIEDLIVLLESLGTGCSVELDKRLELTKGDVNADGAFLQRQTLVKQVQEFGIHGQVMLRRVAQEPRVTQFTGVAVQRVPRVLVPIL